MNLHRLDLVSLALFAQVVRSGSISRGAQQAHLALGAASRRMADLEAAVGAPLLARHSRGVVLTAAGEALLRHAQRILVDVDQLGAELSDYAQGVSGVVRLAANTSAVTQFLPRALAAFLAAHPSIRIEMHEHDSTEVARALLDGRADLGALAEGTPAPGLQLRQWQRDRLVLVVPPGHALARRKRVALSDAAAHDFVSLAPNTSLAQRLQQAAVQAGVTLRLRMQVRSFDAMCQMVAAGLGVAVLPGGAAQPLAQAMGLRVLALEGEWTGRQLLLAARDFAALPRPARALAEHLLAGSAPRPQ
jgi:DNA-binding transcriptional LysR family regulator